MPESEPKPKPLEPVAPGSGHGWKAVLKGGRPVVVHEIPVPPAEAAAAAPRLQRLAERRHPSLSPVWAWGTDATGVWVAVDPNEGVPLSTILNRGRFSPAAAAALGAAVLSGIGTLHEAGIAMGGFDATAVRVTDNGEVRIAGHPAAAVRGAPSQSDLRADVRSCGMAICAAFGVDPSGAPAPSDIAPGLVVTMRSMASGAMGPAADRAQGALREMAAALLAPDRMVSAQSELATRSAGREMPKAPFIADAPAAKPAAAPYQPPPPSTPLPIPASYEPPPRAPETYRALPTVPKPQEAPPPAAAQRQPWETAPAPPPPSAPPARETWEPVPAPPPPASPAQREPLPWEPAAAPPAAASPAQPEALTWEPAHAPPAPASPAQPERETWEPAAASGPAMYTPPGTAPPPAPAPGSVSTPLSIPTFSESDFRPAPRAPSPSRPSIPTPAPVPVPVKRPPIPRRPARERGEGAPGWRTPAIVAGALVVLLVVGGGFFLATRGSSSGGPTPTPRASPGTSPKPSASTKPASPTPVGALKPIPTYAPAANAPVTSVAWDPANPTTSNCNLGGPCKVDAIIHFSSVQNTNVAFIVKFFDRCTGVTTDLPGGAFTPPGYNVVDIGPITITLPSAKSAALVAVTTSPASAASAPFMLGGESC